MGHTLLILDTGEQGKQWDKTNIRLTSFKFCSSKKYPYPAPPPLTEKVFVLDTPPRWNFHSRGCFSPPPPGISESLKNAFALYCYAKDNCFCDKEIKLIQCQIISILSCRGLFYSIINGKSLRTMEAIRTYTTQVMPSLKPANFNCFLSDMLEEGLLEHDHISLNTTIHCVTKQQIDNWNFIHEPTTIVLHTLSCKPWKKALSRLQIKDHR